MNLVFIKMHGIGNDYIYFDCFEREVPNPQSLSVRLSDRHFGIGGDGIVLMLPSDTADARMRMFNADGSESAMCGNAIRCVGKYLYESGRVRRNPMEIETLSGVKRLALLIEDGQVSGVRVDMGAAVFEPRLIPVDLPGESVVCRRVEIGGGTYDITCVSMGNPHCVVFVDDVDTIDLARIGPLFENDSIFPQRVNAEFVQALPGNALKMRVWERGSGETLACGTGACAAVAAAVANNIIPAGESVRVDLKGGSLDIVYSECSVMMTGPAEVVFTGEVEV